MILILQVKVETLKHIMGNNMERPFQQYQKDELHILYVEDLEEFNLRNTSHKKSFCSLKYKD